MPACNGSIPEAVAALAGDSSRASHAAAPAAAAVVCMANGRCCTTIETRGHSTYIRAAYTFTAISIYFLLNLLYFSLLRI